MRQHAKKHLGTTEVVVLVVLVGWLLFNLLTLARYPVPMCDEAAYTSVAHQFVRYGVFTQPMQYVGSLAVRNASTTGRLFSLGQAALVAVFGPSLFIARLHSVIAWVGCVGLLYLIARKIHSHEVGMLAALAFGLSTSVLVRWRIARPDGWAALALLMMFWLYLRLREQGTFWRAFVVGLAGLLAVDVYIGPLFFLPIYGLLVLWDAYHQRKWRIVLGFGVGTVVGMAYLVLARAYPDPAAAYEEWFAQLPSTHAHHVEQERALSLDYAIHWLQYSFIVFNRGLAGIESALTLMGVGLALRQPRHAERRLLFFYLGGLVVFMVFYSDKNISHVAMWLPFMALMIARAIWEAAGWLVARWALISQGALAFALLMPWLGLNALAGAWLVHNFWENDWSAAIEGVNEIIPPGPGLMAKGSWWFARPESRFLSLMSLLGWERRDSDGVVTEQELIDFLRSNDITYIITGDDLHCYSSFPLQPPSFTLDQTLDQYCAEVGSVTGYFVEGLGRMTVQVHHCNFEAPEP